MNPPRQRRFDRRAIVSLGVIAFAIGAGISWQRLRPDPNAQGSDEGSNEGSAKGNGAARALLSSSLPDSAGKAVELNRYRDRIVVVNFWATWCAPCVEEMPELSALAREWPAERVQIVGIGVDSATNVAEFARKHQFSYPLLVAGGASFDMLRDLGNRGGGLPFTVLLSRQGDIAHRFIGRLDIADLRLRITQLSRPRS